MFDHVTPLVLASTLCDAKRIINGIIILYYYIILHIYIVLLEFSTILWYTYHQQCFTSFSGLGTFTVLCHTDMMRSHSLPDELPGKYTGLQATHLVQLP